MSAASSQLSELIRPIVEDAGFELWGLEYRVQAKRSLLRIYIDSDNGVNVDDCATLSREISVMLDVEDPIVGEYQLEVSSPGMDRPLYTLDQYQRFTGNWVKVKLRVPFEGRRQFKGFLRAVENEELLIVDGEEEYGLPFECVEKGNVVPQF
mgnify:CR=1 FL=1